MARCGPDGVEQFARGLAGGADVRVACEIADRETVALLVGEEAVAASIARAVEIDFERASDIADDDEGGDGFAAGQVLGVVFGLEAGVAHQLVVARARWSAGQRRFAKVERGLVGLQIALLGLHDEMAALVEIDCAGAVERAKRAAGDRGFVFIGADLALFGLTGAIDGEDFAQVGDEGGEVRFFRAAGMAFPFGDKLIEIHGRPLGRNHGQGVGVGQGGLWGRGRSGFAGCAAPSPSFASRCAASGAILSP